MSDEFADIDRELVFDVTAKVDKLIARLDAERALADDLAADLERLQAKLNRALDELAYHGHVAEHRYERDLPALVRYQKARER